jgi:hypothetical protein
MGHSGSPRLGAHSCPWLAQPSGPDLSRNPTHRSSRNFHLVVARHGTPHSIQYSCGYVKFTVHRYPRGHRFSAGHANSRRRCARNSVRGCGHRVYVHKGAHQRRGPAVDVDRRIASDGVHDLDVYYCANSPVHSDRYLSTYQGQYLMPYLRTHGAHRHAVNLNRCRSFDLMRGGGHNACNRSLDYSGRGTHHHVNAYDGAKPPNDHGANKAGDVGSNRKADSVVH